MFPPLGLLSANTQYLGHGNPVGQNVDLIDNSKPKSKLIRPRAMVRRDGIAIASSMYLSNKGASNGGQAVGIIRRIASFNFPELRNNHADRTAWINLAMG